MNAPITTPSSVTSPAYARVATLPVRDLEDLMVRGDLPDASALVGWEWRGLNLGPVAPFTPFQKFVKGFYRDERREQPSPRGRSHRVLPTQGSRVLGYNIPIVQDGPARAWKEKPSDADPRRFGFFLVEQVDPTSRDNAYLHALLLDYGRGGNSRLDPTAGLRDYVVRVERGSDELLLGKAYYALGPARVPVGFFVLERHRPTTFARA